MGDSFPLSPVCGAFFESKSASDSSPPFVKCRAHAKSIGRTSAAVTPSAAASEM